LVATLEWGTRVPLMNGAPELLPMIDEYPSFSSTITMMWGAAVIACPLVSPTTGSAASDRPAARIARSARRARLGRGVVVGAAVMVGPSDRKVAVGRQKAGDRSPYFDFEEAPSNPIPYASSMA